ncbi:helix-turn-helix transcriptional regulator [Actinoplanes aureus]|uniref:Helix-turn-helix transcriptional regulator n=1 Tax=Actinoplanes aureus TaxID=2792083 RepID=A0A931CB48_9ACTN|nr:LuxR C-terminal-related transcriptional regulator [Actinoplanes aureus]MBG0564141.1 helix-turn-helix transcriptional regulator [Actinoplanes aureus]
MGPASIRLAVVGVDGAGRTHRLRELAAAATGPVWWFSGTWDAERAGERLVIVDDAHRLDAATLRELAAAARGGVPMVISRRPTIDRPELADLDETVAAGGVELLGALDLDGVGRLVATVTGRPVSPEVAAAVFEASAGVPAVAAAVATAPPGVPPPALLARVQRRFAVLDQAAVTAARVLALRLDLADHVLAAAAGVELAELAAALRTLRDEGLLVPDGERMIPAVAAAVLAELPAAERRRIHDAVAGALVAAGTDPVAAAGQLRAARAATPVAATVYREAGERLRFSDPAAAIGWYDDAADAGADPGTLAAGRAEANALLGLPVEVDQFTLASPAGGHRGDGSPEDEPGTAHRLALVAGAVAAHQGRAARAAELLLGTADPGPALAVPSLVGIGRMPEARHAAGGPAPAALSRFAEGAVAAVEPAVALPLLIEAAEAVERGVPAVVLPDTPHAVAAVIAVAAGDVASAEDLLVRAGAAGVGGPVAVERHRLLLAWVRMRTGRYDTALAELRRPAGADPPGRDRLLRAALAAGVARRRGDIAGLRDAWSGVEPLLARRTADLWLVEVVEELAVAAARLRRLARVEPVLELLDGILTGLDRPVAWAVSLDWVRLQTAIVTEDEDAAAEVAGRLAAVVTGAARPSAQCTAAERWAAVLTGRVEPEAVLAATEDLVAAELPWEASRLAGQAAIRTGDPAAARRLLERARELSEPEAAAGGGAAAAATLSEREVTVARLVLAGSTHREIGAQLYIAPKTVEHHVARIRGKLGANTRAELLAALREMLPD